MHSSWKSRGILGVVKKSRRGPLFCLFVFYCPFTWPFFRPCPLPLCASMWISHLKKNFLDHRSQSRWIFKPCASMDITLIWKEITIAKITEGVFVGRNLLDRSQKGQGRSFELYIFSKIGLNHCYFLTAPKSKRFL